MKNSRFIAFLLAALMVLSAAATGVFALEETGTAAPNGADGATVMDTPAEPDGGDNGLTPASGDEETGSPAKSVSAEDITFTATANGNVVDLTWEAAEEDLAKVSGISYKADEAAEAQTAVVSDEEKAAKAKSLTLEYATSYTFELLMMDGDTEKPVKTAVAKTGEEPAPVPAAPALYAYPAYHSVFLSWTASANAVKYVLYRTDGAVFDVGAATSFTDANNAADTTYSYYVVAYNKDNAGSPASNIASAARVRTCYYRITFKKNVKLTSHDGTKTKHTFKKGQVVYADGFSQGKYQFDYEGHRYHAKWMRIKKPSGDIATNIYENGVTPTLYVNQSGYGSPTGYLIWVSLYSQHVFVFQGSAGNWTLVQDFLCGSGKAKTPTPTGMNKSLHKKMKKYSKHKWWNCFSGNNAIHGSNGAKEIRKLGRLISNGCVRVTNDQAIWIFNTVPKGTRVLVF
jgi:hypothetical protein